MKKLCLVLLISLVISISPLVFAGYYAGQEQQTMQKQVSDVDDFNNHIMEKHYYLEMAIGAGTLSLGALGLWLKYRKKK